MIILDTNVLSASMSAEKFPGIAEWIDGQPQQDLWITSITVFEIRMGIERLRAGKKRHQIEVNFGKALSGYFEGRVFPFDTDAAQEAGVLLARLQSAGRTVDLRDVQIAGIAISKGAAIATRNTRHFTHAGVSLIDPWSAN